MATPTNLHFGRDNAGYNAYAPIPSTTLFSATLVNGAASTVTVPITADSWIVSFSVQPGSDIWVDFTGATAAIPSGASFAACTAELNPATRLIPTFKADGVTANTFSVITANASADVGIAFYAQSHGQ